jgi:hypothetical protein
MPWWILLTIGIGTLSFGSFFLLLRHGIIQTDKDWTDHYINQMTKPRQKWDA